MKSKMLTTTFICLALILATLTNLPALSTSATNAKDKSTIATDMFHYPRLSSPMNHSQSNMSAITATETPPDPWPQHDEFTEDVNSPHLEYTDGFYAIGGLWWEVKGIYGNKMYVDNRTNHVCVGRQSVASVVRCFEQGDPYWFGH